YQLTLPTQQQFASSDKLTVYFGMDNVSMDAASGSPKINLALKLKSGDKIVKELSADSLHAWPQSTNRIFFLDQFDLAGLAPGTYTGALGEAKVAGTVQGNQVEWSFETADAGKVVYKGTLEGGKIKGTAEYGSVGKGTFTAAKK